MDATVDTAYNTAVGLGTTAIQADHPGRADAAAADNPEEAAAPVRHSQKIDQTLKPNK